MFGFACDETPELMPAPIVYAHRLVQRQAELRKSGALPWLQPDAKSQVTFRYVNGRPTTVEAVVLSTQHDEHVTLDELRERAKQRVETLHARGTPGAYLYGDAPTATYSELNSFYLLIDKPEVYGLPMTPTDPWRRMLGDYARTAATGLAGLGLLLAFLLAGR